MKTWLTTIVLASLVLVGAASAAIRTGDEFLAQVQQQVQDGTMSSEQALLTKFHYAFDREQAPGRPAARGVGPVEVRHAPGHGVPAGAEPAVHRDPRGHRGLPRRRDEPSRMIYYSPGGHFRIYYSTSRRERRAPGGQRRRTASPTTSSASAEYFDYSWQREVIELGFGTPPRRPTTRVHHQRTSTASTASRSRPATRARPPSPSRTTSSASRPNDDPDGDVLGAAKVTAAHEFKHATQYVTSNWSEGGWVEVDATWMRGDRLPATNDYHNYLPSGSPISSPATSLDAGGTGSYEDCVWQLYMSDTGTIQIIIDFWNYRRTHQAEAVLTSYNTILSHVRLEHRRMPGRCSPPGTTRPAPATWRGSGTTTRADYPTGSPQRQIKHLPQHLQRHGRAAPRGQLHPVPVARRGAASTRRSPSTAPTRRRRCP